MTESTKTWKVGGGRVLKMTVGTGVVVFVPPPPFSSSLCSRGNARRIAAMAKEISNMDSRCFQDKNTIISYISPKGRTHLIYRSLQDFLNSIEYERKVGLFGKITSLGAVHAGILPGFQVVCLFKFSCSRLLPILRFHPSVRHHLCELTNTHTVAERSSLMDLDLDGPWQFDQNFFANPTSHFPCRPNPAYPSWIVTNSLGIPHHRAAELLDYSTTAEKFRVGSPPQMDFIKLELQNIEVLIILVRIDSLKKALANKEARNGQPNEPRFLLEKQAMNEHTHPRFRRLSIGNCRTMQKEKPRSTPERTPPPRSWRLSIENCNTEKKEKLTMNAKEKRGTKTPSMPTCSQRLSLEGSKLLEAGSKLCEQRAPRTPTSAVYTSRVSKTDGSAKIRPLEIPKTSEPPSKVVEMRFKS
ncbi:hypothetical protein RHSIM_RhsimUnG0224700 [Rhododendron simsii]|uniref:Uncharacterized protein n=1 Tax=Rhododendron simsii TaxID=118357 RepID=A0A834FUH6_RHOSS|nr:hypothetical protein RHSIM_RhsimUnG0224700 [Rhododendron simsii]